MEAFLYKKPFRRARRKLPLNNNVQLISQRILGKIFSYLDLEDLYKCRLVCSIWAESLKKPISNRLHITIDSHEKLESYIFTFEKNPDLYTNFFFKGPIDMKGSITQFFTKYGPYIKGIFLRQCLWMGKELFSIMEKTPNLQTLTLIGRVSTEDSFYPKGWDKLESRIHWPKLKILTLELGGYTQDIQQWNFRSDAGKIQSFIFHLLLAAPNLEKINCKSLDESFTKVVLQTILFRDEIKLPYLDKIDLHPTVGNLELKYLEYKRFPLVSLYIKVQPSISLNIIHNFLASLGNTLKYLKLRYKDRVSVGSRYFSSSPHLVRLKELYLSRYHGSLHFLEEMGSLERLFLEDVDLQTLFHGPWGNPIDLPKGFIFETVAMPGGILCYVRPKSFVGFS